MWILRNPLQGNTLTCFDTFTVLAEPGCRSSEPWALGDMINDDESESVFEIVENLVMVVFLAVW